MLRVKPTTAALSALSTARQQQLSMSNKRQRQQQTRVYWHGGRRRINKNIHRVREQNSLGGGAIGQTRIKEPRRQLFFFSSDVYVFISPALHKTSSYQARVSYTCKYVCLPVRNKPDR